MIKKVVVSTLVFLVIINSQFAFSQKNKKSGKSEYKFSTIAEITTTSVKDQCNTGTCWSFATNSFIETELIRLGHEPIDISEMFIIRHTYPRKANNYIQMHGMANFGEGGQAHDDFRTINEFGLVPESVYPGLWDELKGHDHEELVNALTGYLNGILKQVDKKLSTRWIVGFNGILDAYLGTDIDTFTYKGNNYTPISFLNDYLKFDTKNYVELTSYTHHPYYSQFMLEVPDNWSHDKYYNLPLEELMDVINHALKNNYSVCWDGDVSEKTISNKHFLAILPEKDYDEMTKEEKDNLYLSPIQEKNITEQMRLASFNNMTTTDDHLMHIVGIVQDQKGTLYYNTKNSWGDSNDLNGFLYMSESFIRLKTIAIMVHKDAIPEEIKTKLGL